MRQRTISALARFAKAFERSVLFSSLVIGVIIATITWLFVPLTVLEFAMITAFWPAFAFLAVVAMFL
ncbi:hypothetical protein M3231_15420 [Neobacillus mesonae]|nr:hypothetical protein [Neobacillus mesonae]